MTLKRHLIAASCLSRTRVDCFEFEAEYRFRITKVRFTVRANVFCCSQVKPFLKKLRPTGGLKHLTLIGVHHEQNLRDFKHGFVRQGGTFRPGSSTVKTIKTTTVTHDELPDVSMYVRAIVEKDRASRAISKHCENATLGNSDQGRVGPSQLV